MKDQKQGFFGKLFASKEKNCCSVEIEEVSDTSEEKTAIRAGKAIKENEPKDNGCCSR